MSDFQTPSDLLSEAASESKQSVRDSPDVHVVERDGREFIVVGTAHISRESVDLVRSVIESEEPDCVCIELDESRFEALSQQRRWEELDLKSVIRNRQLSTLLVSLLLASYQKKLGAKLGVVPGSELMEAAQAARDGDIPVALCDRDIRITLRRAWASLSWWAKVKLFATFSASAFESPELSEEDLRQLREKDALSELMRELGEAMPSLKEALIDERDSYLAQRIREAGGDRIVAVVGAGHVEGMCTVLRDGAEVDLQRISEIPSVSPVWKWVGWGIPAFIIGALAYIGISQGGQAAGDSALFWFLANAIPSGIGGIIALGHPATVAAAFFAAPFTSLTPVIGAGYVAAFVQLWYRPPVVREFQSVGEEVLTTRGWWSNRLLRIFLVFLLTTLGSVIGTWVGGVEIITNLF